MFLFGIWNVCYPIELYINLSKFICDQNERHIHTPYNILHIDSTTLNCNWFIEKMKQKKKKKTFLI